MDPNIKSNNGKINIINIDFSESFEQLSEEEKSYLYYLTEACWTGQIIDLFQTSYESPALFMIFQIFFDSFGGAYDIENKIMKKIKENKEDEDKIDSDMINKFLEYAAKFYSNFGNYTIKKKKFFPEFNENEKDVEKIFEKILKTSSRFNEFNSIWEIIKGIIFDKSENAINIDLEEKEGKNCYYLGGIKKEQIETTDRFLLSQDISLLNTRLFYYNSQVITLIGSINEVQVDIENKDIILLYGEFSSFLKKINENLLKAKECTTKEPEKNLIDDYVEFFKTGKIENHIESQKKWVQLDSQLDNEVDIDYNIGWNEIDIDPLNARALFEGFVGFTDNFMSKKYEQIINVLPQLIKELPWPQDFNGKIGKVQFKSFEIICFAKKGSPNGKCLPNYKQVKEEYGIKTLIFSNVFPNFKEIENNYYYLSQKDKELITNFSQPAIKIMTSLKLLVGYDIGKFFKVEKNAETGEEIYNFDKNTINPLTNKPVEKFYKNDENFIKKFEYNSLIMNECIATLTYLYLCGNESVQKIFYVNKIDNKSVTQTCWLLYFSQVISNLNSYNEKEKIWTLEQGQAGWIIMNYILSELKESEEIIKIEIDETNEEKKTFKLNINKDLFFDSVNDIISKLLQKLFINKCLGNVDDALEIINKYSVIDKDKILKVKEIAEKEEVGPTLFLFNNLILNENKVTYAKYQNNKEGIIQSNLERFGDKFNKDIYNQWVKYATNFLKSK